MKTIALDVHSDWSQLTAVSEETGEVLLEMKVATRADELRRIVAGIGGSKRVVFEEGPMSGMIKDALAGVAEEIISSDPTQNALIATAEHSNDEVDARRLALLYRARAIHPVSVPSEPYRSLRSLTSYDLGLQREITRVKNQIKALCRRQGVRYRGVGIYRGRNRAEAMKLMPNAASRWQVASLYRRLDRLRTERVGVHRLFRRAANHLPVVKRLCTIPGVGLVTAIVLVAWVVDPRRFRSRGALSSYGGLGLGQGMTNWQPVGRARASRRGQRQVKRVLFLAARSAVRGSNALAARYRARVASGWEDRKAIRDVARCLLLIVRAVWLTGQEYQDGRVSVPACGGPAG